MKLKFYLIRFHIFSFLIIVIYIIFIISIITVIYINIQRLLIF